MPATVESEPITVTEIKTADQPAEPCDVRENSVQCPKDAEFVLTLNRPCTHEHVSRIPVCLRHKNMMLQKDMLDDLHCTSCGAPITITGVWSIR